MMVRGSLPLSTFSKSKTDPNLFIVRFFPVDQGHVRPGHLRPNAGLQCGPGKGDGSQVVWSDWPKHNSRCFALPEHGRPGTYVLSSIWTSCWLNTSNCLFQLVKDENLKGVVSMNEDYELKFMAMDGRVSWIQLMSDWILMLSSSLFQRWAQKSVKFLQLPTTDIFETPDQGKLVAGLKFINNFLEEKDKIPELGKTSEDPNHPTGTVYIHCKAGRTRSATLVGCYLIMVIAQSTRTISLSIYSPDPCRNTISHRQRLSSGWPRRGPTSSCAVLSSGH